MLGKSSIFVALGIFVTVHTSHAGTLVGKILDKQSNSPLPGATVTIQGTSRGVAADGEGRFIISDLAAGFYVVNVSSVGYANVTSRIFVRVSDSTLADFHLSPVDLEYDEITTTGERSYSAASSEFMRSLDFELRPKQSAHDMLRMVPGIIIAQHAGGGKAEQIFVRGFDADHGTDINLSLDGVPVNMVSHGHGQGYADLHFIIPEVIEGLEVHKGPYFAQYGDLATAGAVRLQTRSTLDYNAMSVEGGKFGTYRTFGMLQLPIKSETFSAYVAGETFHSQGYFDIPINLDRYNLFAKSVWNISPVSSLAFWGSGFTSKWDATGQIPERAILNGTISRFGSIDPSEGGNTRRFNANAQYVLTLTERSTLSAQLYASRYSFQLYSNFTFFANDSVNGDGIEQMDSRFIYGGKLEYASEHALGRLPASFLAGASLRSDNIDVQLYRQKKRSRIETTADAIIDQRNLSFYVQEDVRFSELIRLQVGLRTDIFFFDVLDRLGNVGQTSVAGSITQSVVTPKANIIISPSSTTDLFLNFGGGFHSNDARAVVSNKADKTLPRAWGAEVGFRTQMFGAIDFAVAFWGLDLDNELVYVGDEGTTEPSGRTRRLGIDIETRARIASWLYSDLDVTLSRGRFRDLPDGENFIPLAPTVTASAGLTALHASGLEASVRLRHVSSRPANEANTVIASGYTIFDAAVAYSIGNYRLQLGAENLFNTDWNEAQFDTESRLLSEAAPISELHFTPGSPFNLKLKAEFRF